MTNFYERLAKDTAAARTRFMSGGIVTDLLGPGSGRVPSVGRTSYVRAVYTAFLQESYHHVRAAAPVYALAGSRVPATDEPIREWFLEHAVEEYGHHLWIEDDLRALGAPEPTAAKPGPWCDALVGYMDSVAGHRNPIGLLGDTYVIEGLSQLFASELAGTMKRVLAIPDAAVTYLAKHGDADIAHMTEFRELVNRHVRTEEDYAAIVQVARTEFALYGAMVDALAGDEPRPAEKA